VSLHHQLGVLGVTWHEHAGYNDVNGHQGDFQLRNLNRRKMAGRQDTGRTQACKPAVSGLDLASRIRANSRMFPGVLRDV